ncbi:MAG: hypothetical protein N4A62_05795 [Marinisporobacter sp.]|jgi:hypothetical protein|nr:hypothetical protein [Marinisporobacter sp.]
MIDTFTPQEQLMYNINCSFGEHEKDINREKSLVAFENVSKRICKFGTESKQNFHVLCNKKR